MTKTIAVLGAGTMGHGIAQVCAQAGYAVRLRDIDESATKRGLDAIQQMLSKGVIKEKMTQEQANAALAHITTTTELAAAVADADLIIEAVPERLDLKQRVFADVLAHASSDAILATNTSSIPIADIGATLKAEARSRLIGLHFFNPVPLMPLLEIVTSQDTSGATLKAARDLAERIGKDAIVVKDTPGFATSRLGVAIGLEAIRMLEEGVANAEDIDKAMTLGYKHPMGPLRLTDLVGLDVRLHIAETLTTKLGERFTPPQLLRDKVAKGKLGKKTGEGFHVWP